MEASAIVLTHFSTRFTRASFPRVDRDYFLSHPELLAAQGRVIPAFDFMQLPLDANLLALYGNRLEDLLALELD